MAKYPTVPSILTLSLVVWLTTNQAMASDWVEATGQAMIEEEDEADAGEEEDMGVEDLLEDAASAVLLVDEARQLEHLAQVRVLRRAQRGDRAVANRRHVLPDDCEALGERDDHAATECSHSVAVMLLRVESAHHLVTFFETLQLQPFAIRRTASVAGGKGVEALLDACRHIRVSSSASLKQDIPFD